MKELDDTTTAPLVQETISETSEEALEQSENAVAGVDVPSGRGRWRWLREVVETVLLTVVIFVIINTLTGRFRIEGPSMNPALQEGQYLIINKVVYKLYPPRRGDIVVFHHPQNSNRDLIKRIIGLPDETVEIRQGRVYINGIPLEEPYIVYLGSYSVRYDLGPDDFFVLGDNRPNSDDSHNWGALKRDQIVGKAWISYWPPESWGGVRHYDYSTFGATAPRINARATP